MQVKAFYLAALAASWAAAPPLMAQSAASSSDPNAPVPALIYRSVFPGASQGLASDSVNWREANDQVGQFKRGHFDVLKWEEQAAPVKDGATQPAHGTQGSPVRKP